MRLALLVIALLLAAAGLAVAGVYLLLGLPWSLIAAAVILVAFAMLLRTGMVPNE